MLNSIKIRNFKAIGDEPLELKNLARVNYLVGPNGCGKSSVLEYVFLKNTKLKDYIISSFYNSRAILDFDKDIYESSFGLTEKQEKIQKDILKNSRKYIENWTNNSFYINSNPFFKIESMIIKSKSFLEKKFVNIGNDGWCIDGLISKKYVSEQKGFLGFSYVKCAIIEDILEESKNGLNKLVTNFNFDTIRNFIDETTEYKNGKKVYHENCTAGGSNFLYQIYSIIYSIDNFSQDINTVLLEEPENGLHPSWQKLIPKILTQFPNLQFLISTHSPFIIREALELENQNVYHIKNGQVKNMLNKEEVKNDGVLTFDRAIADLGFEMRDIYYPNCLIYVEGPVDKIYVEYWLKKYIEVEKKQELKRNFDYEFVEYGGSLASHLAFDPTFEEVETSDDDFKHKLFNVFSLNRRVFFITDNDANTKNAFHPTKKRIEEVLEDLPNCHFYKEENNEICTIEDYLKKDFCKSQDKNNKLNAAVVNVKNWHENEIGFEGFKIEAKTLAEKIYNFIIQK